MFSLLRKLIFLAILILAVMWYFNIPFKGKAVSQHYNDFKNREDIQEAIKDIRSLLGESVKAVGTEIAPPQENVTDEERQQLENVLKKEIKTGEPVEKENKKIGK